MKTAYEIPPTAGLPPAWSDLLSGKADLAAELERTLDLPSPQIECSGTAAFVVALTMLKKHFPGRSEVIIPAYTCPLVLIAIRHCALEPVLCDLGAGTFDFNYDHLAHLVHSKTLAIVPTHLGGRVADVKRSRDIADSVGAIIIEDAAQALGAEVGKDGHITFYSLAAGKGLSIFEGGILITTEPAFRPLLLQARQDVIKPDWKWSLRRNIEFLGYTALYNPKGLYAAYGKPRRQALEDNDPEKAVSDIFSFEIPLHPVSRWRQRAGANALSRLPEFIRATRKQALGRVDRLRGIQGLHVLADDTEQRGVWPFLMVMMPDGASRDAVMDALWKSPLGVSRLFIHALPDYDYLRPIATGVKLPEARRFAECLFTISNSLWLEEEDFERICQTIEEIMLSHEAAQASS